MSFRKRLEPGALSSDVSVGRTPESCRIPGSVAPGTQAIVDLTRTGLG